MMNRHKFTRAVPARKSLRRQAVLDAVLSSPGHLSAEQIHHAAAKKLPGIGIATVYRALKRLCTEGEVLELKPADGISRYEQAGSRSHHDHLICLNCGAFIEAADPELEALQDRMATRHGFTPSSHRLEIYGTCSACAGRRRRSPR